MKKRTLDVIVRFGERRLLLQLHLVRQDAASGCGPIDEPLCTMNVSS